MIHYQSQYLKFKIQIQSQLIYIYIQQNSNSYQYQNMFGDSKPRDYSYIYHKDNQPLQIKGNMKRKRDHIQDNNAYRNTVTFGLKDIQKKSFIERINKNYVDLKSIIPSQLDASKKVEKIKTFKKQDYVGMSGVPYLIMKSRYEGHPQKKHVNQNHVSKQSQIKRDNHEQGKKHYHDPNFSTEKEVSYSKHHTQSLQHRITYDLHSSYNRRDQNCRPSSSVKRNPDKTLFLQGNRLGYENTRQRAASFAKERQLAGSYYQPQNKMKNSMYCKRDDWRKSSIVLG